MFTIIIMNAWNVTLVVGPDEQYRNLSDALDHISKESYRVLILVSRDLLQDIDLYIPADRNIQYLRIASSDNSAKTIDFLGCSFFSNGITLEIDSTITMKDCFIFGGSQADQGKPVETLSSKIIINGKVDYVYGGGYAIGPGSESTVLDSTVVIDGQASHLYGGGYAVQSGAVHSGRIHIQINENGTVDQMVNGGNCLVGPDCHSIIREIDINITGKVKGNISLGGYAAYNSSTFVHDEIHLTAGAAELSGVIFESIKLDEKSAVTISKVTGSISSEQQDLLKFSEHEIQIIQSEPVSKPIGTQNGQNENKNGDSCQSPDTEEKPDFSNSIIPDISAGEQIENDKAEITPKTGTETDKSNQENNNNDYSQSEDNHSYGIKNENYQVGYTDSSQEEKSGRKSHLSIIGILFIIVSLLVIYFLLSRQKTNNQSTPNENKSEETVMITSTPALISTEQNTAEEGFSTSSREFITPTVLSLSAQENDNSDSPILTSPFTPTETVKPERVITSSVMFATVTNNPVPSNTPVNPSPTLKPTSTRSMDTQTATKVSIIPSEKSSATPVATETHVTPSATPRATYTKVVPSETLTATEVKATPTATVTLTIAPSETSTPQQSDLFTETIITEEEELSLASIQGAGAYFYQRPYRSQEFVLRWLNNGTEVEILSGTVIRNNAEWYEVFVEQYGQTGWIISSAVSDNPE